MLAVLQTRQRNGESGFSLIEVVIVVTILTVLGIVAIPIFLNQKDKAQQGVARSDARAIVMAVNATVGSYTSLGTQSVSITSDDSSLVFGTMTAATPRPTGPGTVTSAVKLSAGSVLTGSTKTDTGTLTPSWCIKIVNGTSVAVANQLGVQPSATTCTNGVAS